MIKIKIADLHCDTLYRAVTENIGFDDSALELSLSSPFDFSLQCYAVWIPDGLSAADGRALFENAHSKLISECKKHNINLLDSTDGLKNLPNGKYSFFTLENSSILDGDITFIKHLAEYGVKIASLTWNERNCVGGGADVTENAGITEFGKSAVAEFERNNITVDVSHASERLFYDVCEISRRPFTASHSNSKSVTPHRRNLTDEQFCIICSKGGLVGLNFHNAFLNSEPSKACAYDILRHAEHFLSLSGENNIAIGSDFDGGELPRDIRGSESLTDIAELFLRENYSEELVNKIFYLNALDFFERL